MVCVDRLGRDDEPDSVALQCLDVVEAVDERTAEPIQLPDAHAVEPTKAGVGHEAVETWSAGLGSTDHIVVVRIPGEGEQDSGVIAKSVPG